MGLLGRKTQSGPDRYESMAGVPVLNKGVSIADEQAEKLSLTVTIKRGNGFLDRFRPTVMNRRIKLDELGSFVVRLIDGKRNMLDIVAAFEAKYKTNRRETQLSVVAFLKSLARKGVASIVIE